MTFNIPESLEYNGVKVGLSGESADRIQNAVNYLLPYGFGKSLQDSVAGLKKLLSTAAAELSEKDAKLTASYREDYPGKSVDEIIAAEMAARAEAILSGTVGTRGPRLSGPEATHREVVDFYFRGWAKSMSDKGKALPTLKSRFGVTAKEATDEQKKAVAEAVAAIKARYAELNSAKIEEEVARRLAMQEEELDVDLDLGLDAATGDESEEVGEE